MITENLSTLKIHKLTQEQYNRELEAGNIDPSALYLTPEEDIPNIYIQNEEPTNAKEGSLWVDMDAQGSVRHSKFDASAYGLPILYLTGDTTGMSKDDAVTLNYVYGERSGSCTLKWQGSSSIGYPKKNYTIQFDNAFEAVEGWGEQKKYCLKANFIDHSHARNVVSAKLWGEIVKSRENTNANLSALPNGGAIAFQEVKI